METTLNKYREDFTFNISETIKSVAEKRTAKYMQENNKRESSRERLLEHYNRCPYPYWVVRNLLEDIKTDDFQEVIKEFRKLYPIASEDFQNALSCGLVIKASEREFFKAPFYFTDPAATEIREAGINGKETILKYLK